MELFLLANYLWHALFVAAYIKSTNPMNGHAIACSNVCVKNDSNIHKTDIFILSTSRLVQAGPMILRVQFWL